jgi:hypothetical protein
MTGEYEFLSCYLESPEIGRFEFYPLSFPYGSGESGKALIESFGF